MPLEQPKSIKQFYPKNPEPQKTEQVYIDLKRNSKVSSLEDKIARALAEKAMKAKESQNSVVFTEPTKGRQFMTDNRIMVGFPDSTDSPNKPAGNQNLNTPESNSISELVKKHHGLTIENGRLRVNGTPNSIETTGARIPMEFTSIEKGGNDYYIKLSAYNELSHQLELILKNPFSSTAKHFISHFNLDYGVTLSDAYGQDESENKKVFRELVKQQLGLVQSLMDSQKTKEIKTVPYYRKTEITGTEEPNTLESQAPAGFESVKLNGEMRIKISKDLLPPSIRAYSSVELIDQEFYIKKDELQFVYDSVAVLTKDDDPFYITQSLYKKTGIQLEQPVKENLILLKKLLEKYPGIVKRFSI